MATELQPGAVLGGSYELAEPLGEGGMGSVWLARHTETGVRVALKLLKRGASEAHARRLSREARAAGRIGHPNVREVLEVIGGAGATPILVMEYLDGRPLGSLLAASGRLGLERAAEILLPVVSAVGTAHEHGIVHRDLKPDNIFLVERPAASVKVVDFGIAKLAADGDDAGVPATLTSAGTIVGTPHYMSPEMVFGDRNIDHRADIWALGLIAYRMLSGVLPTAAENVGQTMKIIVSKRIPQLASVAPEIPADVCALIDRMLMRSQRSRLASLHEALYVLRRYARCQVPDFGTPRSVLVEDAAADGPTIAAELAAYARPNRRREPVQHLSRARGNARAPTSAPIPAELADSPATQRRALSTTRRAPPSSVGVLAPPQGLRVARLDGEGREIAIFSFPLTQDLAEPSRPSLTPALRAVAELLLEGLSAAEIAERRGVTPRTVSKQIRRLYRELGVDTLDALAELLERPAPAPLSARARPGP